MENPTIQPTVVPRKANCKILAIIGTFVVVIVAAILLAAYVTSQSSSSYGDNSQNTSTTTQTSESSTSVETTMSADPSGDELISLDNTWYEYRNYDYHFAIKVPKQFYTGTCGQASTVSNSKVIVDSEKDTVYITSDLFSNMSSDYSMCEKIPNTLEIVSKKDYPSMYWEFRIGQAQADNDIEDFIDSIYGADCSIGSKTALSANTFKVGVNSGGAEDDNGIPSCWINYITEARFSDKWNEIVKWDMGQAITFMSDNTGSVTYDTEMTDSFRFL